MVSIFLLSDKGVRWVSRKRDEPHDSERVGGPAYRLLVGVAFRPWAICIRRWQDVSRPCRGWQATKPSI